MDLLVQMKNEAGESLKQFNGVDNLKSILLDSVDAEDTLLTKALGGFEENDLDMIQLFNRLTGSDKEILNVWVVKKHIFGNA